MPEEKEIASAKLSVPTLPLLTNSNEFPAALTRTTLPPWLEKVEGVSVSPINVLFDPEPVSIFANVILSPDLEIERPVPASRTTSSVVLSDPVSLIFSSSLLSPFTTDIL